MLEALNYEGENRSRCLPLAISVLADALADALGYQMTRSG